MHTSKKCLVVVGGGTAGLNAAFSCRKHFPEIQVTLVDGEEEIGYYRPLLAHFIVGKIDEKKLFFWRQEDDPLLNVRLNISVRSLDRKNRRLHLENGEELTYNRLILTSGGRPLVPPVCQDQSCRLGVFPVRDLTVARAIRRWLPEHRKIMVLGGGLVGVKTAVQLSLSGFPVLLAEKETHLFSNLLTPEAALPIEDHLRNLGLDIRTGSTVEEIRSGHMGDLKEVRVSGQWVPCDTLLVAIGSTPDLEFLEGSGLLEEGELVVSSTLQTLDKNVFAAGDAVTIKAGDGIRHTPWTWPQAVSQGKLAGANVFRSAPLSLAKVTRVNAQNIGGLPLAALGARPSGSEIVYGSGLSQRVWREVFLQNDRIVGGALVGNISGGGPLHARMNKGERLRDDMPNLLKAHTGTFSMGTWMRLKQKRRIRFLTAKGKV